MFDSLTFSDISAFLQVIAIDLVLSGDNAIVIGLATAGLPAEQRRRAILFGIMMATVLRIVFAAVTSYLLGIAGLKLAGGLLLAFVCWKMWRELRAPAPDIHAHAAGGETAAPRKTFLQAAVQIVIADVSMSLDNVLAVAGAARENTAVLVAGLLLSIALMGVAANYIARLLARYRWIAYVGLAIIVYVAASMIYHGLIEVLPPGLA